MCKLLLIVSIVFSLVLSSCTKYEIKPERDFEVYLHVQDDAGNIKNKFAYGEDIYFVVTEYNLTSTTVEFGRESNIPTRLISVYDKYERFVGKLVSDDIFEQAVYLPCKILSKEYKTLTDHWLNNNKLLEKGSYKAIYDCRYLPHTPETIDSVYKAEVNFEVY